MDEGQRPLRAGPLATLDRVLRGGFTRREDLARGRIEVPASRLAGLCLLLGGVYGLCLGCHALFRGAEHAWLQVIAGALKVPLLFLLTLAASFPSLYVFAALQRLPLDLGNTLRLLVLAILVQLTVIASLGPVFAFFAASTPSYPFLLLLNVAIFAIGGLLGLMIVRRAAREMFAQAPMHAPPAAPAAAWPAEQPGPPPAPVPPPASDAPLPRASAAAALQTRRLLGLWCVVYGIVGAQMGWLLRPFLGTPDAPFAWFRPREDNVFVGILRALRNLFQG